MEVQCIMLKLEYLMTTLEIVRNKHEITECGASGPSTN